MLSRQRLQAGFQPRVHGLRHLAVDQRRRRNDDLGLAAQANQPDRCRVTAFAFLDGLLINSHRSDSF
jgi:hypothetical protein